MSLTDGYVVAINQLSSRSSKLWLARVNIRETEQPQQGGKLKPAAPR
jgi:hypothetical protein